MASLRFVSQKLVSPSAAEDLTTFLTDTNTKLGAYYQALTTNGFIDRVWQYWAVMYGNAFTSEQGFVSDGSPYYQNGPAFDPATTLVPLASSGKVFTAVVWCKMVEEGLISSNMKISQFLTTGWAGQFAYYTNGTGYELTNYGLQPNQTGYMGATGLFTLGSNTVYGPSGDSVNYFDTSKIQIAALLNWNFGCLYDGFQFGNGIINANMGYQAPVSTFNLYPENTNMSANATLFSLAAYNYAKAGTIGAVVPFGGQQIPSYVWFNMTGNNSYNGLSVQQIIDEQLQSFTTGTHSSGSDIAIPLGFRTNSNAWGGNGFVTWSGSGTVPPNCPTGDANYVNQKPYDHRSQCANYSFNYELLGYIMDVAIRQNYDAATFPYHNFAEYARAKVMTPLNMTRSFIVNQELPNASSPFPNIAALRYDPYQYMCTPCVVRANTTSINGINTLLTGTLFEYYNGNPSVAYSQNPFSGAMFAACLYSSGANYLTTGVFTTPAIDISDDGFGAKYIRTTIQHGVATTTSGGYTYATDIPIGGTPIIATLSDWSKLLVMILQGGKASNGQRVINKQSIDSIFSSRTDGLTTFMNSTALASGQLGTAYGLGIGSTNSTNGMTTSTDLNLSSSWGEAGAFNTMSWMDRASGYYYTAVGSCINRLWCVGLSYADPTYGNYDLSPFFGFNSLNYRIIRCIINKNA